MIKAIQKLTSLSLAAEQDLLVVIKQKQIGTGTILVAEGSRCNALYVIKTGIVRHFVNMDGIETTGCFSAEGDWVTVTGFFNQRPSRETIVALEDTTLYYITHSDLLLLYTKHSDIERFGRLLAEWWLMQLEELYVLAFMPAAAQERYEQFVAKYGHVLPRVPLNQLASFLRMDQSTLSRIRARSNKREFH